MATLSVCNNPACAVTVEEKAESCPKCGGAMRRVGDSPARGIVLLIAGLFLFGMGAALALFLGPMMLNPDPDTFTGTPEQGLLFFSLFVLIALMGLAGLANGIHIMKTGQQSGPLKVLTLALGAVLVLMAIYIVAVMPKPS
jgi:hypothetical protein